MTLYELAKLHQRGVLDMDITDKEIDMCVAITVDTNVEPTDWYGKYIDLLAKSVKVEWWRENMICLDLSGWYRPYKEKILKEFEGGYREFDDDEFEYDLVLWTEQFVAGYGDESTYKELVKILTEEV